jgi:hypothetical protein
MIVDCRFMEVARAAQALAPRVALSFLIKLVEYLQSTINNLKSSIVCFVSINAL